MQSFFGIFYLFFFLGCVTASLFILFHLLRYALDRKLAFVMSVIFSLVVLVLLTTNSFLFFTLPLGEFSPFSFNPSSAYPQ